jgi:hypothetical protein
MSRAIRIVGAVAAIAVSMFLVPAAGSGKGWEERNAGTRCGKPSGYPDYYDLRTKGVKCKEARKIVDAWVGSVSNVFNSVDVRGFRCDGSKSRRKIGGVRTFRIDCKDHPDKVKWWIVPTH